MKVFICHAHEDKEVAEKIYRDLKQAGIEPWIDKHDLLIGQNWKLAIKQAIQESSYFIALLSSHSVTKHGFVNKELKIALDLLEEKPQTEIFILPILLEDCEPNDERLKDLQWGDFSNSYEEGFQKVLKVILSEQDVKRTDNAKQKYSFLGTDSRVEKVYKYNRWRPAMTVSKDEYLEVFQLDNNGRPLEYIKNDYQDNGDGTITDHATRLRWQKSGTECPIPCEQAELYIRRLNIERFAGINEWRLPTIEEFKTLLEREKQANNLYINPIFEKTQSWCWSADRCSSGNVWDIGFNYGDVFWGGTKAASYVRAVCS